MLRARGASPTHGAMALVVRPALAAARAVVRARVHLADPPLATGRAAASTFLADATARTHPVNGGGALAAAPSEAGIASAGGSVGEAAAAPAATQRALGARTGGPSPAIIAFALQIGFERNGEAEDRGQAAPTRAVLTAQVAFAPGPAWLAKARAVVA